MHAEPFGFFRAKNFINKRHYRDALVILYFWYKNLPNVARVSKKIQPHTSLKKLLSSSPFYLSSISLKSVWYTWQVRKNYCYRWKRNLFCMQAPFQQRATLRHVEPPNRDVGKSRGNSNSSLVCLLIGPLT